MHNDWFYYNSEEQEAPRSVGLRHLAILGLLLVLIFSLLLPLSQRGRHRMLSLEYRSLQQSHRTLAEEKQLLEAHISALMTPEALIDEAWRENIQLVPITEQHVYSVASRSGL